MSKKVNWQGWSRILNSKDVDELQELLDGPATVYCKDYDIDTWTSANRMEDNSISIVDRRARLCLN